MGNLLGSPITEKDTHVGKTHDAAATGSIDGGGLHYGISSMQGWRIHMEDAHIAQPFLYAERKMDVAVHYGGAGSGEGASVTEIETSLSAEEEGVSAEINISKKDTTSPSPQTAANTTTTIAENPNALPPLVTLVTR